MKVLFAGYGSIAKRHISNLRDVAESRGEAMQVDLLRSMRTDRPEGIGEVYTSPSEVGDVYDAVFVTNPTSMHYETLLALLDAADSFFIEKPVFDKDGLDLAPFLSSAKLFYVACPLRYSSVIRWVRENVDFSRVISVRAISSSYLPDWRPGTDYRRSYSAHADMGGGVDIDLVHEWDYLVHLMGMPQSVQSLIARKSSLDIDSNDVALYIADYGDKTVELHLDYFGRRARRELELLTDEELLTCDLMEGSVMFGVSGERIDLSEGRNAYQKREISHFIDLVYSHEESDSSIERAVGILKLAKGRL